MTEEAIISRYFKSSKKLPPPISLGIGDDAALFSIPNGYEGVITVDTLNEGIHFPHGTSAFDIGWKSIAVNLSDLASMGAKPSWITLSLSLPELNEEWLSDFSQGLFSLLDKEDVFLIGGDTNKGPLSISIQAFGTVPKGRALLRSKAKVNDYIVLSGTIGGASLALKENREDILPLLNRPEPLCQLGISLIDHANACIDLSDGLYKDLGAICQASHVGADIYLDQLPFHPSLKNCPETEALRLALTGGDDYQLCFTLPPSELNYFHHLQESFPLSIVGKIVEGTEIHFFNNAHNSEKKTFSLPQGYEHFQA